MARTSAVATVEVEKKAPAKAKSKKSEAAEPSSFPCLGMPANVLLDLLSSAAQFVPKRVNKPSLGMIFVEIDETGVKVSACDENSLFSTSLSSEEFAMSGFSEGQSVSFLIELSVQQLLASLKTAFTSVELCADNSINIKSGTGVYSFPTQDPEPFLEVTSGFSPTGLEESERITGDSQKFAKLLKDAAYAVSTDDTRMTITAVAVTINPDEDAHDLGVVEVAATDGHRLSVNKGSQVLTSLPEDGALPKQTLLISGLIAKKLVSSNGLLSKGEEVFFLQVSESDGLVRIISGATTLTMRLLDGQYPNYRQLIPSAFHAVVEVSGLAVEDAAKRVSSMSANNIITFCLAQDEKYFDLESARSLEGKSGKESISCEIVEGTWPSSPDNGFAQIGVNNSYLVEAIQTAVRSGSGMVRVKLNTITSPFLIVPSSPDGADGDDLYTQTHLLMPVQIRG